MSDCVTREALRIVCSVKSGSFSDKRWSQMFDTFRVLVHGLVLLNLLFRAKGWNEYCLFVSTLPIQNVEYDLPSIRGSIA